MIYGIVPLLILILDIYVVVRILGTSMDPAKKLLWVILVLVLPLVGPILYFVLADAKA